MDPDVPRRSARIQGGADCGTSAAAAAAGVSEREAGEASDRDVKRRALKSRLDEAQAWQLLMIDFGRELVAFAEAYELVRVNVASKWRSGTESVSVGGASTRRNRSYESLAAPLDNLLRNSFLRDALGGADASITFEQALRHSMNVLVCAAAFCCVCFLMVRVAVFCAHAAVRDVATDA